MIWDDIRKRCPLLRAPDIQVIRVPFSILDWEDETSKNGDVDTIIRLIPGDKTPDVSWLRYPYQRFVVIPPDENAGQCVFVRCEPLDGKDWLCESFMIFKTRRGHLCVLSAESFYVEAETLKRTPSFESRKESRIEASTFARTFGLETLDILNERLASLDTSFKPMEENDDPIQPVVDYMPGYFGCVVLATLALLSCKNVGITECHPPRQQRRAAERAGLPLVSWHELVIQGGARSGNGGTGTGEKLALHWVRGHFKDMREKGLFGQHKGVYWWSPHLAGQADRVVLKDYVLSPAPAAEDP